MNEVQEAAVLEAALTGLGGSPTADQILHVISGYSDAAVSIALKRTGGGGGGADVPFVGADPPADPTVGELWFDTDDDTAADGSAFLQATVTLSSDDLLTLGDTPITLVAAPGAGKVVVPFAVYGAYSFGTTPYTDDEGEYIRYAGSDTPIGDLVNELFAAGSNNAIGRIPNGAVSVDRAEAVNKALVVASDANLTDGDGTFAVTVSYYVVTVA